MCGERIKVIDKYNNYDYCPLHNEEELQEHATLCDKNKNIRDDWIAIVKVKFKEIAKKRNATEYEKKITEEMEKDMNKYFNNESNLHASQQIQGMREVFRGVVVNEWVSMSN